MLIKQLVLKAFDEVTIVCFSSPFNAEAEDDWVNYCASLSTLTHVCTNGYFHHFGGLFTNLLKYLFQPANYIAVYVVSRKQFNNSIRLYSLRLPKAVRRTPTLGIYRIEK